MLLEVKGVNVHYQKVEAVTDISIQIEDGQIVTLIGEDGLVTEGTASNAWIVTDAGEIVTRQLSQAILAGVTRRTILEFAAARGMTITERAFTLSEAKAAREAFQTSTTALVKPVLKIDAAVIGGGAPGPVTEVVFTAYLEHFASFGGAA